jgi:polyisoprenoid-binding protein YceI
MKLIPSLLLAAACTVLALPALADQIINYTIDPTHSQVRFSWLHAGFSHPGAAFKEVTGTITGNHDHPELSSVDVSIAVNSLDTYVPILDDRLLNSGDYFKTKEFPAITFKSTGMSDVDKVKRTFKLKGMLTINGISKPVVLNCRANLIAGDIFYDGAPAAGFDASTTLIRSEYGMGKFAPMVSDELAVSITVEAIESVMYAKKVAEWKKLDIK